MTKVFAKKLYSILFLTIFFVKMVISIGPIIIAHFDSKSVNAVIMQLEIEDNTKPADVKEISVKEYLTITSYNSFEIKPVLIFELKSGNDDHAKHIQPFYPSVPTPPPNV